MPRLASTIPSWTAEGLLPPFTGGGAAARVGRSPYDATILEFATRFSCSLERARLLKGLLEYRIALLEAGITGFQWINGSFTEDVEMVRRRPPNDIDVVTFFSVNGSQVSDSELARLLLDRDSLRERFSVDSYVVDLRDPPNLIVASASYWNSLWSHTKTGHSWKGYVQTHLEYAGEEEALESVHQRIAELAAEEGAK